MFLPGEWGRIAKTNRRREVAGKAEEMQTSNCINYLLTVTQHEVNKLFTSALSEFGLTPGQYGVLGYLWESGSSTPSEIAQFFHLDNSSVSSILDRMQKADLISRVINPEDRRGIRVLPTEKANSFRDGVLSTVAGLNEKAAGPLTEREFTILKDLLRKICG